VQTSNRDYK